MSHRIHRCHFACFFVLVVTCSAVLNSFSCICKAEQVKPAAVDIRDEAIASRDQLAANIAQVASKDLRDQLLELQCGQQGDCRLAHWYSGKVEVSGEWKSLDEVRQAATEDAVLSGYYALRDKSRDVLGDHVILAKWCRKNKLAELEKLHWLHVLRFQAHHPAALNVLELVWHNGVLLSRAEFERQAERDRLLSRKQKKWKTKAKRLRRTLEKGEPEEQVAAKKEIREIRDPLAVPALVEEFQAGLADTNQPEATEQIDALQAELMASLGNIPSPEAVEILVENVAFAPANSIRYAAADQLKAKQYAEFLPLLLSELELPIESAVSINHIGNHMVTNYLYTQEDATGTIQERSYNDYRTITAPRYRAVPLYARRVTPRRLERPGYWTKSKTHPAYMCGGHMVPERHVRSKYVEPKYSGGVPYQAHVRTAYFEDPRYERQKQLTYRQSKSNSVQSDARLAQLNERIQQKNERIAEVLTEVTGEKLGTAPRIWWNWWSDYLDRHPDLAALGMRKNFNTRLLNQDTRGLARGALVWTLRGKRPVETILPGDFVLSQNPHTGELTHKVVLAIQATPEMEVRKIELNDSTFHTSPGHVVWVAGHGWQKVSTLANGNQLHGVSEELRVNDVQEIYGLDGYDIVVEGFSTLFVGEQGVLVHDATTIRPAHTALPGFSAAAVAEAAQLLVAR